MGFDSPDRLSAFALIVVSEVVAHKRATGVSTGNGLPIRPPPCLTFEPWFKKI